MSSFTSYPDCIVLRLTDPAVVELGQVAPDLCQVLADMFTDAGRSLLRVAHGSRQPAAQVSAVPVAAGETRFLASASASTSDPVAKGGPTVVSEKPFAKDSHSARTERNELAAVVHAAVREAHAHVSPPPPPLLAVPSLALATPQLDRMMTLLEQMAQHQTGHLVPRNKGNAGEALVLDILQKEFNKDDYQVEHVAGETRATDIRVRRAGYTDIRIEVKYYAPTHTVPVTETDKFIDTIRQRDCHGICVALGGGFSRYNQFSMAIQDGKRLVVFINWTDGDPKVLRDLVFFVHQFDRLHQEDGEYRLTPDDIAEIEGLVNFWIHDLKAIKNSARHIMKVTGGMDLARLLTVVHGRNVTTKAPGDDRRSALLTCPQCLTQCHGASHLARHTKVCPQAAAPSMAVDADADEDGTPAPAFTQAAGARGAHTQGPHRKRARQTVPLTDDDEQGAPPGPLLAAAPALQAFAQAHGYRTQATDADTILGAF